MYLNDDVQKQMRDAKIISESEVILKEGDMLLAVNVLTQNRRVLSLDKATILRIESLTKSNKKLLKG